MDSGNIKVYTRIRPFNEKESQSDVGGCIDQQDKTSIKMKETPGIPPNSQLRYTYDGVFDGESTQKYIYDTVAKNLLESVFQGINCTVFAYGQTSSGKTFTCMGPSIQDPQLKGLIPRMVEQIFDQIADAPEYIEFRLKLSLVEIYMEKLRDLIDIQRTDLKIRESKTRGIYIQNCTQAYVASPHEVMKYIKLAISNRAHGQTNMNEASSRSHMVFIFTVYQNNLQDLSAKSAKLSIIDLAGSQKVAKSGAEGKLLDEAKQINKSLSALGNVINALTEAKMTHIPYRDSKLTRILQESLGGNARTSLIVCVSPSALNDTETLSTLRFGNRAKNIKNKPKVNREFTVAELLLLLEKAELRIKELEKIIKDMGGSAHITRTNSIRIMKKLSRNEAEMKQGKKQTKPGIKPQNIQEVDDEDLLAESRQGDTQHSDGNQGHSTEDSMLLPIENVLYNDMGCQTVGTFVPGQAKQSEVQSQLEERLHRLMTENDELSEEKTTISRQLDLAIEKSEALRQELTQQQNLNSILQNSNAMLFDARDAAQILCGKLQERIDQLEAKLHDTETRENQVLKKNQELVNQLVKTEVPQVISNLGRETLPKVTQPSTAALRIQELEAELQKLKDQRLLFHGIEESKQKLEQERRKFEQERSKIYQELELNLKKSMSMEAKDIPAHLLNEQGTQPKSPEANWKVDGRTNEARLRRKNDRILELERELVRVREELYRSKLRYQETGGPLLELHRTLSRKDSNAALADAKIVKVLRSFSRLQEKKN